MMGYAINFNRRTHSELRRCLREQVRIAVRSLGVTRAKSDANAIRPASLESKRECPAAAPAGGLPPPAVALSVDGIHAARRAFKRARALLALLRKSPEDIALEALRLDEQIGMLGRMLSVRRDLDVVQATWDELTRSYESQEDPQAAARLRELLVDQAGANANADEGSLGQLTESMRSLISGVEAWTPRGVSARDILKQFERAAWNRRRQIEKIGPERGIEESHELRKRLKRLNFQGILLSARLTSEQRRATRRSAGVASLLGKERDLALLGKSLEKLSGSPHVRLIPTEANLVANVGKVIERRRHSLRTRVDRALRSLADILPASRARAKKPTRTRVHRHA